MGCTENEDSNTCQALGPEQAVTMITEDTIVTIEEAASALGRIHRLVLDENVSPSPSQLNYLQQSFDLLKERLFHVVEMSSHVVPRRGQSSRDPM